MDALFRVYQLLLSPDHGILKDLYGNFRCRFYPSCSEYAREAVRQYGLVIGSVVGLKRIVRCNPWNVGGYDPIKLKYQNKKRQYEM